MNQDLSISRVMQTGILQCAPDTPLCEAAKRMSERHCSSILVMEKAHAVGIWTEHDALNIDFSDYNAVRQPISERMSQPVASIYAHLPLGEAALKLQALGRRHLLVIDDNDMPVGILSQTDIALNQGLEPYLRLREVHAAMRRTPLVLPGDMLLAKAAHEMHRQEHDAAVVLLDNALGILTERDLVRFIARHPGNTPIAELASHPLLTIDENAALIHARDLLIDHRIRHLAVLDSQGNVSGLLGFRDMLAGAEHLYLQDLRQALEQRDSALAASRQHLQLAERVIDSSLEGIVITDSSTRIEFINPAFTHMTGYALEDVVGKTPRVLSSGRQDDAFYQQMWDTLKTHGYWRGEVWNRKKTGELYLELLTITAITNDEGETQHYAGLFTDITHIRENEQQIRHLAYYDVLTRLPNRRLLEDRITLAIRHAHRSGEPLAVIFIDLDHFKQVNDTLGHAIGDELLLQTSARMQEKLREDDTLARLGGDEFIALLPGISDFSEATRIAQRLIDTVSAPYCINNHTFRIGCSLGVSLYPDDGDNSEILIQNADAAMYRAKKEGRNTYRLYRSEMDLAAQNHLTLETELRTMLDTGDGLFMMYQPLVSRQTGLTVSAEALVRWQHPTRGVISPGEFIPLAEKSGLILSLGEHVLDNVIRDIQHWKQQGLVVVPIAINLSAAQFWQHGFVQHVEHKLANASISPELITFELTESLLLNKQAQGIEILTHLSDLGCRIALDDFGTGYSSLSYLQHIPAHSLKIDRSFIEALDSPDHSSRPIIAAIASMAQELGLTVVAEGVESEGQWAMLGNYAIDTIQGFYTGYPVEADTFSMGFTHSLSRA
ncbi:EAL domain-containing protein [Halomonas vilamensis]|uniref:EAL domain-containing protein n=1 Tax=Vreelandella vilamensis TaxID=531309 RepID=A0ABU1H3M0_9GAMM|nr:EAL domain-containing protein [Halomonas vilamensis]MDR5898352.1 EAL domain-containing protein [Halomonas vilamensis]